MKKRQKQSFFNYNLHTNTAYFENLFKYEYAYLQIKNLALFLTFLLLLGKKYLLVSKLIEYTLVLHLGTFAFFSFITQGPNKRIK